jgi:hypothetical protein
MKEAGWTDQKHRLYNAGDRIVERLHYSVPDGHDIHVVAAWQLDAPSKEFFEVPQMVTVGDGQVPVQFARLLMRPDRYGGRGVVLLDANWKRPLSDEEAEDTPIAATEKEAIAKANRHLEHWEKSLVQAHIDQCNAIRTAGGVPMQAKDFIARLLRKYSVADPAAAILQNTGETKTQIEELTALVKKQQEQIDQLLAGGKTPPKEKAQAAK